ncbi:MAG: nucleotidyltransferase domain-containing protein [Hyphomicrobiales bacterium]|nr:nucleotidyltransferase domain-containing protein [Hyphomicrobiales bacterium]
MLDTADHAAAAMARAFAATLAQRWQSQLGDSLLSVTLIGSLAHGGFSRRYSDIDIAVITDNGLTEAALEAMRMQAAAISETLARKTSIFWTDRSCAKGRFPPLDRTDFIDYGIPLIERERVSPRRPALDEIRRYLCGSPFESWSESASRFAGLATLEPTAHKPYLRAHLYPARFLYSFMTGRMGSNDQAVAWLHDHAPPGLDVGLIAAALDCRHAAADPDALFPARAALPRQVAACAALVHESAAERP